MKTATFSDFRNSAKRYFDEVEKGNIIEIYRYGKPIALISPYSEKKKSYWKEVHPLRVKGISLGQAILDERRKNRS